MAPPVVAVLPLSVLLLMLNVPLLLFRTPAPSPLPLFPAEIVKPDKLTRPGPATFRLKTRVVSLPLIVRGPFVPVIVLAIVTPVATLSSVDREIVCGPPPRLKSIAPPSQASATACRNDPAPLSLVFITVTRPGLASTCMGAEVEEAQPESVTVVV